ncbi:NAD(P)H-dependent flavin oxidoreductase YrpB (nitropropane dioxygenase family) [Leucobacter exalbidus]|uniref:NAD(P)H-dependent flavin oxidoreductase YrpB (Nitropropane dioxygenase family) n=1 Tax=Leucobacter exalbidus TaxID=662960 RepID=A0A940T0J7_9MICO|nr:nitronate monooxygenase [Leucobacter exalbidus]MBP1325965.1 NAD(P)H-dependent flavin oxidoreductase YrpB (nitropropane dioxygenase family) [Leucobacter exalbidus]
MSTPPLISTALTRLTGVDHPVVQTGMGWVSGPRLVSATAEAGGLGFLASATMTIQELEQAIITVKSRTDRPFGVNMRADAGDASDRVKLLVKYGVPVAGFALAPKRELIDQLKEAGIVVIPSIGAVRHAEKLQAWGVDAVIIQGGEGGGHTGAVPTSLLIPSVVAAVDLPVIAAGGFYDGRGLAAALAYGAVGIGMGTRFLLTSDSSVPDVIKQRYLEAGLDGTVVTTKADGMPHRLLRTEYIEGLESTSAVTRLAGSMRRGLEFKRMSGMNWVQFAKDAVSMKRASGRSMSQMVQAGNTPILLKAGVVDGDLSAGMLASGQVAGLISDLPSCDELISRIVREAAERLREAAATVVTEAAEPSN